MTYPTRTRDIPAAFRSPRMTTPGMGISPGQIGSMTFERICLMSDDENWLRFEQVAMPHLDAAYNLARWLTHNDHDAQDVVQDALVRAMRYFKGFRGDSARAWLLQIVRHTCYSWLKENRPVEKVVLDDDD